MSDARPETFQEQLDRVRQMATTAGEGEVWDLSANDQAALSAVLSAYDRLAGVAAGAARPPDDLWDRVAHRYKIDQRDVDWAMLRGGHTVAASRPRPQEGGPIALNVGQVNAARTWAADDRLWTTQNTVESNLQTFARLILKLAASPPPQEPDK